MASGPNPPPARVAALARRTLAGRRLRCAAPDLLDRRGDRRLLVWGDVPHWMVVDEELAGLLSRLDGRTTLDALLAARPDWRRFRDAILATLRGLIELGVIHDGERPDEPADEPPTALPPIENIALNLTARCNLRCSYCYRETRPASPGGRELTARRINAFLDAARPLCSARPSLVILGGEPLLEAEKLIEVARHARRRGFATIVSTNGIGVTDAFARRARRIGLSVQVSLDGPDAATHEVARGKGTFDQALLGIRTLLRHGARTILSSVVHRQTLGSLEAFYDLALSLGVDEARFIPLKLMGGAARDEAAGTCGRVPMVELIDHVREVLLRRPEFLPLMKRDALSILGNQCRFGARRVSCGVGRRTLLLDADGKCYPCLNTCRPELCFGDASRAEFDLEVQWRESPVLAALRADTVIDSAHPSCAGCAVRHWCLAGCRGETLAMTGRIDRPSPHCEDQRRAIVEMLWLLTEHPDWIEPATTIC